MITFLFTSILVISAFAQNILPVGFGENAEFNSTDLSTLHDGEISLQHGVLTFNSSSKSTQMNVRIDENRIINKTRFLPVCYTTDVLNVSQSSELRLTVALDGIGSLDELQGHPDLNDWVDIYTEVDGVWTRWDDSDGHTMYGVPSDYKTEWMAIDGGSSFRTKVCMQVTGEDEAIILESIQAESRSDHQLNPSLKLIAYPNPAVDAFTIENIGLFDLSTAQLTSVLGQVHRITEFPANTGGLAAGTYTLQINDKTGKVHTTPIILVR